MPHVVIAAGGTAGHVVPALAVADALAERGAAVSFIGTRERAEAELVPAAGYEIDFLAVRGLDRRNPLKAAAAAGRAGLAVRTAARSCCASAAPTPSWAAAATSPARPGSPPRAWGCRSCLTEADSHLGITNRMLARRARRVCLAFEIPGREGALYLHTGRPVPRAILDADRDEARAPVRDRRRRRPACSIFGGSLGRADDQRGGGGGLRRRGHRRARLPRPPHHRQPRLRGDPRQRRRRAALHAARLPARPRRRPRGLRSGAGALRRLGLRADRSRAAARSRSLPLRDGRPSAHERALDGRRRRCDRRRGRRPERRLPAQPGGARCSPTASGSRRWRPPRDRSPSRTPPSGSRLRS